MGLFVHAAVAGGERLALLRAARDDRKRSVGRRRGRRRRAAGKPERGFHRRGGGGIADRRQAEKILCRAQQRVVVVCGRDPDRLRVWRDNDRGHLIVRARILVLVPGDEDRRISRPILRCRHQRRHIRRQERVALGDGSIEHVVRRVRSDEGKGGTQIRRCTERNIELAAVRTQIRVIGHRVVMKHVLTRVGLSTIRRHAFL